MLDVCYTSIVMVGSKPAGPGTLELGVPKLPSWIWGLEPLGQGWKGYKGKRGKVKEERGREGGKRSEVKAARLASNTNSEHISCSM